MKRRPIIASALAVSALLAAALGTAGTALADPSDNDIIGFPVMTFGTGTDSNAGEYTYNLGLLDYNAYGDPDYMTPVADLGTATNGIDLSDTIPGYSGVDITNIVDGITAGQLQEWADKGWVNRRDSGSRVWYDAVVLAVQQPGGDDSVEPVGGYAAAGGRAMPIELKWVGDGDGIGFNDIHTYGVCGGSGIVLSCVRHRRNRSDRGRRATSPCDHSRRCRGQEESAKAGEGAGYVRIRIHRPACDAAL